MQRCFLFLFVPCLLCVTAAQGALYLSCERDNDLYRVLVDNNIPCRRFDRPGQAVTQAPSGAGVLILARDYPLAATPIDPSVLDDASQKNLRLYIEFPKRIEGLPLGGIQTSPLARCVVTSDLFGDALAPMRILAIHGCRFVTAAQDRPHLVLARVAGYNMAVYGLPLKGVHPILFEHPTRDGLLIATTKLSQFVTGRYGPHKAWQHLWQDDFQSASGTAQRSRQSELRPDGLGDHPPPCLLW